MHILYGVYSALAYKLLSYFNSTTTQIDKLICTIKSISTRLANWAVDSQGPWISCSAWVWSGYQQSCHRTQVGTHSSRISPPFTLSWMKKKRIAISWERTALLWCCETYCDTFFLHSMAVARRLMNLLARRRLIWQWPSKGMLKL